MNRFIAILFFFCCAQMLSAQVLQNINYNYLYNPNAPFTFSIQVVNVKNDSVQLVYQLQLNDTTQKIGDYSIKWFRYSSLSDKEGLPLFPNTKPHSFKNHEYGMFSVHSSAQIIVGKIQDWYFFKSLNEPQIISGYLTIHNKLIDSYYIPISSLVSVWPTKSSSTVFYYSENFPAAAPAFSVAQSAVSDMLKPDSVFNIDLSFTVPTSGLYLLQSDTTSSQGIAFRAEGDYPKYSQLKNLIEPLTYITTKSEFERLKNSYKDKKSFDKIILSIVGNAERAKLFMRNYYKRVESANRFFTSYKEGWKTDRGMIYIVFGQPDFVYKFTDREVWDYKSNETEPLRFIFTKSPSLFDPGNYILVRKKSYQEKWLEAIDLNRNARF